MSQIISIQLAQKAAYFYAQAKWGNVLLDKGTPILGIKDNEPKAYAFMVGLKTQHEIDIKSPLAHVESHIKNFAGIYGAICPESRAGIPNLQMTEHSYVDYEKARNNLLAPEEYGTIAINALADRHPAIMAYDGIPFSLVGPALVFALNNKLKKKTSGEIILRMENGDGYPHFFGEFTGENNKKELISLMDGRRQSYRNAYIRSPLIYSPKQADHFKRVWKFIENAPQDYLLKMSPGHIKTLQTGFISGVPDYPWTLGCAPTTAANILGYWDVRGYSKLIDAPPKTYFDLIQQLAEAMETDSSGSSKDKMVDDGLESVCNDEKYGNNYAFSTNGPDSCGCWGMIVDSVNNRMPCFLIVHGHKDYRDHSVAVVGYRRIEKDCEADDYFVTIHDTWPTTGINVEIPYLGSVDGCNACWQVMKVYPGQKSTLAACSAQQSARLSASRELKVLFRFLASKQAKGLLADGFQTIYQNTLLSEEFNNIMNSYEAQATEFGRHLNAASYYGQYFVKEGSNLSLKVNADILLGLQKALTHISKSASTTLQAPIQSMIKGLDELKNEPISIIKSTT